MLITVCVHCFMLLEVHEFPDSAILFASIRWNSSLKEDFLSNTRFS